MIKRISTLLIIFLILISLNALADSVPYTFGDFTFPIPDNLYVLTRDKHDVAALGLEINISQHFADSLFASQPGLQIDCMRIDPFYEISVSQQPMTNVTDFSKLTPTQLKEYRNVMKDDIQLEQVELTEEMQILSHSQTNFFYYAGTAEMNGSMIYITAYVTCENNIMTTIALKTYDSPADESIKAVLDDIVQGTVLYAIP
jgi:hypothetical protein